ncbi:Endonuclease/exonuclease/phosphatase [Hypoxylon crocopeplum]|nr:Endonuclease/exonuclease/phosphatase [Hypoxylon crocopeplum]
MDEIVQKAIKQAAVMKKAADSVPWQPDQPHAQSYYTYDNTKQKWEPAEYKKPQEARDGPGITRLALYSWNIDFMLPFDEERMDAALAHLEALTTKLPPTTAVVIFLQECLKTDLEIIGEKQWVRDKFHVTDVDTSNWASDYYGTTTLIDRRLDISSCFRVHYAKTRMERDALFADVLLSSSSSSSSGPKTIRLCNTHLESLAMDPAYRPPQMQLAAGYMREAGIDGALAAGDFNAIQDFDRTLHAANSLRDAYLEQGGAEDSDAGYTWGQQAATDLRTRYGCSRMDKVYFTGGLAMCRFERFGADVQLTEQEQRDKIVGLGFDKAWITDHLGVVVEVEIV